MTAAERLTLLKADLQLLTSANDDLLNFFLNAGEAAIEREGITNDGSMDYEHCLISYAAYLFRKRAASTSGGNTGETAMPRFLRYELNNLRFSQSLRGEGS